MREEGKGDEGRGGEDGRRGRWEEGKRERGGGRVEARRELDC